jgi:hypothetical protein
MNELDVLRKALSKQANRIANLSLDLDIAYAQIELLDEQLKEKQSEKEAE